MRERLVSVGLVVFMAFLTVSLAEESAKRDPMKASELPGYEQLRDPFWPIGYTRKIKPVVDPSEQKEPDEPVKIEPKWPRLKLKAVTSSPKGYIAILDGIGLVEEGQIVRMTVDGIVYRWRIGKITSKGFAHQKLDAKAVK